MATPLQKLHFVQHPRYGRVYPVVTLNTERSYPKTAMLTTVTMTVLNTSILYSTFIMPIYSAAASALFANPFFLLPCLGANYLIWRRSHVYFYGDRSEVVNIFLKPNGKQIMLETRDGESRLVNNTDIYHPKTISDNHDSRVDFNFGANNYCYIRGNTIIQDSWVLDNVLNGNFVDTRNTDYDFDLSKEFTWEFRDLVEIKKRNRVVDRVVKPTIASLTKLQSGLKRKEAIERGALVTKRVPMENFKMYEYFTDKYSEDKATVAK
jgi:hypothetical protein